ncbi:MAG: very short patch repair endonuclease [Sphingobacteriales bacterium]|nr:MAG: very short patch repair endonuclease [Sphingobacteriales bacterium]
MAKSKEYKLNTTVKYVFETTPERSKRMSNIKSKNTQPELILRKALWNAGIRYRLNVSNLPGKPDIVIRKKNLAIFIDGEFWHGYKWEEKKVKIKANRDYWIPKIEKNIARDIQNNVDLEAKGFKVLRFWEQEIKKDLLGCLGIITSFLMGRKSE